MDAIRLRTHSSLELVPPSIENDPVENHDDHSLEGIATNAMLLLKLIHNNNEACAKTDDDRREQRLAGMITILDDIKARMLESQGSGTRRVAEFRRCNTELKPRVHGNVPVPREKKSSEAGAVTVTVNEIDQLRKDLNTSLAERKSIEMMCSSLGREKEFMAVELSKKVHELTELEELVDDLKAQNESLSAKVRACAVEHEEGRHEGDNSGEALDNVSLQERNKELSGQLLKSLDGYRSMKRRYKDAHQKAMHLRRTTDELEDDVAGGQARLDGLRQLIDVKNGKSARVPEEFGHFRGTVREPGVENLGASSIEVGNGLHLYFLHLLVWFRPGSSVCVKKHYFCYL